MREQLNSVICNDKITHKIKMNYFTILESIASCSQELGRQIKETPEAPCGEDGVIEKALLNIQTSTH